MPGSASSSTPSQSSDHSQYVFLAGAISGVAEGVTIQPLEMLKTRFQINQGAHLRIIPTVKGVQRAD
jgi:solute carrier family 25 2-oxodicarboxylate transporter 21